MSLMEKPKYQVFISSPFKRLEAQRSAAIQAVLNWGHMPIALETYSSHAVTNREVIYQAIQESQIYILILGHRYGSIVDKKDISYTEMEFEIAKDAGLDILSFLYSLDEAKEMINNDDTILDKAIEYNKLKKFHEKVNDCSFWKPWQKDTNFEEIFGRALGQLISRGTNKQGWVKVEQAKDTKKVEMALKNRFTLDMVSKINGFTPLDERCSQHIKEKETLSKCFRELCLDKIIQHQFSLFFESGTSTAFLARELGRSKRFIKEIGKHKNESVANLYTNNILAYLELWLTDELPVTIVPKSVPGEKYGATYGVLDDLVDNDRCPDFTGNPLDEYAAEAINKLSESKDSLPKGEKILLLGSISGMQLSEKHKIHCEEDYCIDEMIKEKVDQCLGFHVGSYKNKLFKRYLIETGYPLVMMLPSVKIDMPIDPARCHFLFDNSYKWDVFISKYPLAFCIGCEQSELLNLEKLFKTLEFKTKRYVDLRGNAAIWANNNVFAEQAFSV